MARPMGVSTHLYIWRPRTVTEHKEQHGEMVTKSTALEAAQQRHVGEASQTYKAPNGGHDSNEAQG